jgi:octaprenyl-diphosphate synthase
VTVAPAPKTLLTSPLDAIRAPVLDDLAAVDALILERLSSDVVLINQLGHYIIGAGGKRVRPLIVILAARAAGYSGHDHVPLAAIIEFIHTATLLHDDVVDASDLRRGRETANHVFGNEAAVLTGDFLYSRAFQMMAELDRMAVMKLMADTTNVIAEGEVLQLLNQHDPDTTEARYYDVIYRKTARLFETAGQLGALLTNASAEQETALAAYGRHLGNAFQLVDDALDYAADPNETGKNLGDDLAEGKPTLPLLHVLENGSDLDKARVRAAIEEGSRDELPAILNAIESTGAIPYTLAAARNEAEAAARALDVFPDSAYRQSLADLAAFTVQRTF